MKIKFLFLFIFLLGACQSEAPSNGNESKTKFLTAAHFAANESNGRVPPLDAFKSGVNTRFLIEKALSPIRYSVQIVSSETTKAIPFDKNKEVFANQLEIRKALKNLGNNSDGNCADYKEAVNMADESIKTWLQQLRLGMADGRIPQEGIHHIPDPVFVAAPAQWNDVDIRIYYYCEYSADAYYQFGGEKVGNPATHLIEDNEPFVLTQGAWYLSYAGVEDIESLGIKSLADDGSIDIFIKNHLLTNLGISFGLYAPNFYINDSVKYSKGWQHKSLMLNNYRYGVIPSYDADGSLSFPKINAIGSMTQEDADAIIWMYNYFYYPNFNSESCTGSWYVKASELVACVLPE